jgi:sec-independent protein translocase protein TatA
VKENLMVAEIFGVDGIVVIIVIAVLLLGGTQIPKLARSLGSAKNQFEAGLKEGKADSEASSNGTSAASDAPTPAPAPPAEGKSQTS